IMDRADVQVHKAFQKQPTVSVKKIKALGAKARYYKNIGMGFVTPKEAKEGTYIDKKCPFTGNVSIRGRIIKGMYNRFEKRHRNIPCHCAPCFEVNAGDIVTIRPHTSSSTLVLTFTGRVLYANTAAFTN
ncbi:bifunctional 40S ribosomal protein S11, partial [Babesia duncani]